MFFKKKIPDGLEHFDGFPPGFGSYPQSAGKQYPGVLLKGPCTRGIVDYINRESIQAIYLNQGEGWDGGDCSFLSEMPSLKCVHILAANLTGLSALEQLPNLEKVSLNGPTKEKIDFTKITNLEDAFLSWKKGYQSIFDCANLKRLYIDSIKINSIENFASIKSIASLTIGNCPISDISFLEDAASIETLALLNCRMLEDFSPISSCTTLKRLDVSGCKKLTNLDFVSTLHDLEVLLFADVNNIETLEPIVPLKKLKAVNFFGSKTTIVDGDLSVFEKLPNLAMAGFAPRRHYTHKSIVKWNWNNFNHPAKQVERK